MPDNFLKITAKWLLLLLALNYLNNYILFYMMQKNGIGALSTNNNILFSVVIPIITLLGYFLMVGLGLRELSRSNQYKISVGSVFGFVAIMVVIPVLINYGMLYYRSFSDENLRELFTESSYQLSLIVGIFINVVQAIIVLSFASLWRTFRKAGKKGWYALIPIYNLIIMSDIIKKDRSLVFLFIIPIYNLVALAILTNGIAKAFNRSIAFAVGLYFLPFIFYPILAFGNSKYIYGEYEVVKEDLDLADHLVE